MEENYLYDILKVKNLTDNNIKDIYKTALKQYDCSMFIYDTMPGGTCDIRYGKKYKTMTCLYISIKDKCYHIVIRCHESRSNSLMQSIYKNIII